jgi:hypothetical protein
MSNSPEIDLRSLPLHELLAAPVTAAIQAQQQASLGLVSFIRDVGFTGEDDQPREVRVVDFHYTREGRDAEGNSVTFRTRLRVPLLAMISLPNLEIDSLNVNFLVGLQSVSTTAVSPQLGIPAELQNRYPFLQGHSNLRVTPTSRTTVKGAPQTTRPHDLDITVAVSSEEPLDGVQRILTALTGVIAEETK